MNSDSKDNDDVKRHLLNIEARLDRISVPPQLSFDSLSRRRDDEIDLREIWNILWDGKWWIIGITFWFAVGSVVFALSLPDQYRAEIVLAPAQEQNGGMGGLVSQYGGLAAMAGITLGGGESNDINHAIMLLNSWPFLEGIVNEHNLKPLIMGVKGWNKVTGKLVWKSELYDPERKSWLQGSTPDETTEPTSYETYEVFREMLVVSFDEKKSMLKISVDYFSPMIAEQILELLVDNINETFRVRDIQESKEVVANLEQKIQKTSVSEMQVVFYSMIEAHMKTIILAEVSEEYLLKTVVPAKVPEVRSSPNRALIVLVFLFLGSCVSIVLVLVKAISQRKLRIGGLREE